MIFEDAKPYIDERVIDVKQSLEHSEINPNEAFVIIVKLIDLFEFDSDDKDKAMEYIRHLFKIEKMQ